MTSDEKPYRIFTYGTLRSGEPNNDLLMDSNNGYARFMCEARLVKKYPLVIASKYNIPFLLAAEGLGHQVHGEIYEIDEPMLQFLDEFESHPRWYVRTLEPAELLINGQTTITFVWVYMLPRYRPFLLELPFLERYTSNGDHNLKYVTRYYRYDLEEYCPINAVKLPPSQ